MPPAVSGHGCIVIAEAAHGDARGVYDSVQAVYLPVGLAVFVVVVAVMALIVVRYRARPGRVPRPTGEHRRPELAFAAAITLVCAGLLAVTLPREDDKTAAAPAVRPDVRVDVTSFRWGWTFRYPDLGVSTTSGDATPAILRVPTGSTVRFTLTTRDVIHAFWIPELRFKHDLFPGRHDALDLRFPRTASFMGGHCAVFCGLKHADMTFTVIVMPRADFDAWVAAQRARA